MYVCICITQLISTTSCATANTSLDDVCWSSLLISHAHKTLPSTVADGANIKAFARYCLFCTLPRNRLGPILHHYRNKVARQSPGDVRWYRARRQSVTRRRLTWHIEVRWTRWLLATVHPCRRVRCRFIPPSQSLPHLPQPLRKRRQTY